MSKQVAIKAVNYLNTFSGRRVERWTERFGNCVGYWTYTYGDLSVQRAICIHVIYRGEELASFQPNSAEFDAVASAMERARERQQNQMKDAFLNSEAF
jgi:hypothetical protein